MDYISAREAADLWGISQPLVRRYCRQGRIPGAKVIDDVWMVPEDSEKPEKVETLPKKKELPPLAKKLVNQKKKKNNHELYDHVQIYLTYCSSRMASNRLTRDQMEMIFRKGKVRVGFEPLKVSDLNEVINHFVCIDYMLEHIDEPLSQKLIKQLHYTLMFGTVDHRKDIVAPGTFRRDKTKRSFPNMPAPSQIPGSLSTIISEYEAKTEVGMREILDFHVLFEQIVPFDDGNGRIGRVIMFKECLRHDIMPFIIDDKRRHQYLEGILNWDDCPIKLMDVVAVAQERFEHTVKQCKLGEYRLREYWDQYAEEEAEEPIDEFAADEEEQKRRKKENYTD